MLAEGVFRARVCALPYWSFVFLLSQVSQRMELKKLHHPKKTTCRFVERDVSFCGKQRVVLDWRSKSCFEDGVLGIFWGRVAA